MKKRWYLGAGLIVAALSFQSCKDSDSNDGGNSKVEPKPEVAAVFAQMYPNANGAQWSKSGEYWVADFTDEGDSSTAYYDDDGAWYLTDRDLETNELPTAISDAIKASAWATWRIDDVDVIKRDGIEDVYSVELEKDNEEIELIYSVTGTLLNVVADDMDDDDHSDFIEPATPDSIDNYINENFPGAKILDRDTDDNEIEVDIYYNNMKSELTFSKDGAWISTETDYEDGDAPEFVKNVLASSEYAGALIEDVDYFKSASEEYYEVEIEVGKREYELKISASGEITVLDSDVDDDDDDDDNNDNNGGDDDITNLPASITDYIEANFSGAQIEDVDRDNDSIEIDLKQGNLDIELEFTLEGELLSIEQEIALNEIPSVVTKAIAESEYKAAIVEDIKYYKNANGEYYEVDIELADDDYELKILADGTLTVRED